MVAFFIILMQKWIDKFCTWGNNCRITGKKSDGGVYQGGHVPLLKQPFPTMWTYLCIASLLPLLALFIYTVFIFDGVVEDGVTLSTNDLIVQKADFDARWPISATDTVANIAWQEGKSGCYYLNGVMNTAFLFSIIRSVCLFFMMKLEYATDVWWIQLGTIINLLILLNIVTTFVDFFFHIGCTSNSWGCENLINYEESEIYRRELVKEELHEFVAQKRIEGENDSRAEAEKRIYDDLSTWYCDPLYVYIDIAYIVVLMLFDIISYIVLVFTAIELRRNPYDHVAIAYEKDIQIKY